MKPFVLRDYQIKGSLFLAARSRALLADDMGLGKTYQCLHAIELAFPAEPKINILIVCRASLVLMWGAAVKNWLGSEASVYYMKGVKEAVTLNGRFRFVVVSNNYIQKASQVERLTKLKWHVVISDEAHDLKNWRSKTCRGFVRLTKDTNLKVWLLTGTPATRSAQDYYSFLNIIQPGSWGTYWEFSELFCNTVRDPWSGGKKFEGINEKKKHLLKAAFAKIMLRRRKEEVAEQLPRVIENTVPVAVSENLIAECLELSPSIIEQCIKNDLALPAHIMKVCRSIGLAKVPVAIDEIENRAGPQVVFACHTDVIKQIGEKLTVPFGVVTGEQSREEKDRHIQDFQEGVTDIILCNIKAGGVGITLHRAAHMLIVEQYWSPAIMDQAIARIVRIGQRADTVQVTHLIAPNTVDTQIVEALKYKRKFMKEVLGDTLNG